MKKVFENIPVTTSHEVHIHIPKNSKRLFVLLHGYLLNGEFVFKKMKDSLPEDAAIMAPNGPFVVPVKKKDHFKAGYAWYFYDSAKKNFYINYNPGADYVKSLLKEAGLSDLPITLIGYSQGGYLAPKIADIIPKVDTVIGLACIFRNERFKYRNDVLYHQIHSQTDLVVDYKDSKNEFEELKSKGNKGSFITLVDNGHRLDTDYLSSLKNLI